MSLISNFMDFFKRTDASSAEYTEGADAAAKHREALEAERDELASAVENAIGDGRSDAEIDVIEKKLAAVKQEIERTILREKVLRERAGKAAEAEAEAARLARYKAAQAKKAVIVPRWRRCGEIHAEMVQIIIEAHLAQKEIDAANADLPEGAEPIVEPEIEVRGLNYDFRVGRMREKIKLPPFTEKDGHSDYMNLAALLEPPVKVSAVYILWRDASHARKMAGSYNKTEFVLDEPRNPFLPEAGRNVERPLTDAEIDDMIRVKFKDEGFALGVDPAAISKLTSEEAQGL